MDLKLKRANTKKSLKILVTPFSNVEYNKIDDRNLVSRPNFFIYAIHSIYWYIGLNDDEQFEL